MGVPKFNGCHIGVFIRTKIPLFGGTLGVPSFRKPPTGSQTSSFVADTSMSEVALAMLAVSSSRNKHDLVTSQDDGPSGTLNKRGHLTISKPYPYMPDPDIRHVSSVISSTVFSPS